MLNLVKVKMKMNVPKLLSKLETYLDSNSNYWSLLIRLVDAQENKTYKNKTDIIEIGTEYKSTQQKMKHILFNNDQKATGVLDAGAIVTCGPPNEALTPTSTTSSKLYQLLNSNVIATTSTAEL